MILLGHERLRTVLANVSGIHLAFIFGSIAAGTSNIDSDIDLFIIGNFQLRNLTSHLLQISAELSRKINPHCLAPEDWLSQKNVPTPSSPALSTNPKSG
jgi:predicted nucleotidyltransferase